MISTLWKNYRVPVLWYYLNEYCCIIIIIIIILFKRSYFFISKKRSNVGMMWFTTIYPYKIVSYQNRVTMVYIFLSSSKISTFLNTLISGVPFKCHGIPSFRFLLFISVLVFVITIVLERKIGGRKNV